MSSHNPSIGVPDYRGHKWIPFVLPGKSTPWPCVAGRSSRKQRLLARGIARAVTRAAGHRPWRWPREPVFFIADPHADAAAFSASLAGSGGIRRTGSRPSDFELTETGRKATFVIGGDCLDKGPGNLQLLHTIRALRETGARVKLLAGNHDMRLWMGMRVLGATPDPRTEHFLVRMGPKVVPLLKEVRQHYLSKGSPGQVVPRNRACRHALFPRKSWFEEFPRVAGWVMPEPTVQRELLRMRRKVDSFEAACHGAGLTWRDVYATLQRCRELFVADDGEFSWFYRDMQLAHRAGSFLFVHAGLNDRVATMIEEQGIGHLNRLYRQQMRHDPFEFYYGPLANMMRTKYRPVDMPLSRRGVDAVHRHGLYAVIHGHRNHTAGQRIVLRKGMIHIESDTTLDRNSRRKEGLDGYGAGVTIVSPSGQISGVSIDYPQVKVFDPESLIDR